jgi:Mn2+/Fe2+ NRAMP family transporter
MIALKSVIVHQPELRFIKQPVKESLAMGQEYHISEDIQRVEDRMRVLRAYRARRRWYLWWLLVGPGILVMLGENDAPSMLTYAATGAQFGVGFFLPLVIMAFAMAFVVQEITVRLGAVVKTGHADLIYRRFGSVWGHFAVADLLLTNVLTLITEFVGIVAGAGFFGIPPRVAVAGALVVISAAVLSRRYWRWERLTLLLASVNCVFIPVALMTHPDWQSVGSALLLWQPLPPHMASASVISLILADIGATVTPWMIFFQQSATADKGLDAVDITYGRFDTLIGALLAALVASSTVIATAALQHRINPEAFGAAQFAQALEPIVGRVGAGLFALGVMEAGLVAAIAISTSSAYAFGEVWHHEHSLNRSIKEAPSFYGVLLCVATLSGAMVLIPGFPLEHVVILVNVIAVLTMPPALAFLLLLANDVDIMGPYRNTRVLNWAGIMVGGLVSIAGVIYAWTLVWPSFSAALR